MLKGVVKAVGKGQVTVLVENGMKVTHKQDGDLKTSDEVIVYFDYHNFKVTQVCSVEEFRRQLNRSPDEPDETFGETDWGSDSESSLPIDVGEGVSDFEDSESESDSSFQLFEGEFGADPDELD